jgi:CBS domain-containing protein
MTGGTVTSETLEDSGRSSEFEEAYDDERELRGALFGELLSKVPRRPTLILPITASIADAIRAMNDRHVGVALIVDNGKLAGIFTERDVLRKVALSQMDLEKSHVSKVMTKDPFMLPEYCSIAFALHHMSVEGYRHLPLVKDDGTPVGVVGVRDIVAYLVELFPESLLNIPPEPTPPRTVDGG